MKRFLSFLLPAVFGMLVSVVPAPRSLFSRSEMREVNRRLDSIGGR